MGEDTTRQERQAEQAALVRQQPSAEIAVESSGLSTTLAGVRPSALSPAALLQLQRVAGNSAVARLLAQPPSVQRDDATAPVSSPAPSLTLPQREPLSTLLKEAPPKAPARQPSTSPRPRPAAPPVTQPGPPASAPKPVAVPALQEQVGGQGTPAADTATAAAAAPSQKVQTPAGALAPQPPAPPSSGSQPLLKFHELAAKRRTELLAQSDTRAAQIRQAVAAAKQYLQIDHAAEASEIQQVFDQSIAQIATAQQKTKAEITTNRDVQIREVSLAAELELANLEATVPKKQTEMRAAGASRHQSAVNFGEQETQRATADCDKKAIQALGIGERKVVQYQARDRGGEMGAEARRMAAEAASQIREAGAEIAKDVRNDAQSLGVKFVDEANEAAASFADGLPAARKKIEQEREHTLQGLTEMAQQATAQLDKAASQTTASLNDQRAGVMMQTKQSGDGGAAALDDAAERAVASQQAQTLQMCSELDQFTAGIGERAKDRDLEAAGTYLSSVLDEFDDASLRFVGDSSKAFDASRTEAKNRTKTQLAPLLDPIRNTAAGFEAQSAKASADLAKSMTEATTQSVTSMRTTVADLEADLQKSIDQSSANWDKQLTDGQAEIRAKVDKGLAEQAKVLDALPAKMDDRAQEIADESWLSRALKFVGGVLLGFLKALGIALLAILAIALVVVLVVLFIAYVVPGGLGIILAAAIFLTVNAAAIALVAEVVGVLVGIAILCLAAYKLYQAKTRNDLSPEQRGELVGGALFDIVTVVFGAKIVGKLLEWLRMRPPVLPDAPPPVQEEIPVVKTIPSDPAAPAPVEDVKPAGEPAQPVAAGAPAKVLDPEAFGRAIGAELRGQRGAFRTICDRVTAAKLPQADAVRAVEGATKEMGLNLATVPLEDGSVVVSSVMPGTQVPVVVIRPDGSAFYGSADLIVDPTNVARPLRLANVQPRGAAGPGPVPAAGAKAAEDLTKAPTQAPPASGTATATATAREVTTTPVQLQSKFKHAADFGINGNWNPENGKAFDAAIKAHVKSPDVQLIEGSYRGDPARIFVDPKSGLAVITTPSGEFISGWKLNPQQLQNVLTTGKLGGG